MRQKTAAEIFREVDPNLKVIPGGIRHRTRKSSLTSNDWDRAGGLFCPGCGHETLRLIDNRCPTCYRKKSYEEVRAMEYIAMALTYRVLPKRR